MENKPAPSIAEVESKTNSFFKLADTNNDKQISLKEFKDYIKKDSQILSCLMSFGLAKTEDMGQSFATDKAGVPMLDPDLDLEIKSMAKDFNEKKID